MREIELKDKNEAIPINLIVGIHKTKKYCSISKSI